MGLWLPGSVIGLWLGAEFGFLASGLGLLSSWVLAEALGLISKDPRVKLFVKIAKKAYPYVEDVGANVARAIVAFDNEDRK